MTSLVSAITEHFLTSTPRPGLHQIPGTQPLTIPAAVLPPMVYYAALLFLAPPTPPAVDTLAVKTFRNVLALLAAFLFFRLPLAYHVPQSIGLTYQLGLVGIYGGCRVLDLFFISPFFWNHIPRRVRYDFQPRKEALPHLRTEEKEWTSGGVQDPLLMLNEPNSQVPSRTMAQGRSTSEQPDNADRGASTLQQANDLLARTISGPDPRPVYETARTESTPPVGWADRAAWALELELSMRGTGFTWTTADVRHTRETWLPTVQNRLHSIFFRAGPTLLVCWTVIRIMYVSHLQQYVDLPWEKRPTDLLDRELSLPRQLLLTAALGSFLMTAFSVGHSLFAIMLHPLFPSPLAFFPPLYTTRAWEITSIRNFWSYCWHRLFARLFLVYGIWPGEWVERKLTGKAEDQAADVGKVLGAFGSSAFVHSFSVRGVLAGEWRLAAGEAKFFCLNGLAVVVEGAVLPIVKETRKRNHWPETMWYDAWIGRLWWLSVLLWTGRNFARGWVTAELVREMAFM